MSIERARENGTCPDVKRHTCTQNLNIRHTCRILSINTYAKDKHMAHTSDIHAHTTKTTHRQIYIAAFLSFITDIHDAYIITHIITHIYPA